MANADAPFGLRPVRYTSGGVWGAGAARPYLVPAGYSTALFVGDPVIITGESNEADVTVPGGGYFPVGTLPAINKATAGDDNKITGVIVGFYANPDALGRTYSPASTQDVALVCDDPDVLFEIQADGAVAAAAIGLNAVLIYTHAGSTTSGLSGVELDTTSDVPAADASNQLTIVSQVNRPDNEPNSAHNKVLVTINQHTRLTGAIGV